MLILYQNILTLCFAKGTVSVEAIPAYYILGFFLHVVTFVVHLQTLLIKSKIFCNKLYRNDLINVKFFYQILNYVLQIFLVGIPSLYLELHYKINSPYSKEKNPHII